jgi:glutamyl-tRNA synthetase
VLIREDGAFLYTLPSVVDDIDMGITHVVRGEDHTTNTGVQIEIFEALGAKPPAFAHFSLLVGADGEALSKRLGSLSIKDLREQGFEPLAIASHIAKLGTSDALEPATSLEALAETFDFSKMGRAPARYDGADLHAMSYDEARPRLQAIDCDLGEGFWTLIRANLALFDGVANWAHVVRGPIEPLIDDPAFVAEAAALLPESLEWSEWAEAVKAKTGAKGKALFLPLRRALTGMDHGPEMGPMLKLIGRETALKRLAGETA